MMSLMQYITHQMQCSVHATSMRNDALHLWDRIGIGLEIDGKQWEKVAPPTIATMPPTPRNMPRSWIRSQNGVMNKIELVASLNAVFALTVILVSAGLQRTHLPVSM